MSGALQFSFSKELASCKAALPFYRNIYDSGHRGLGHIVFGGLACLSA